MTANNIHTDNSCAMKASTMGIIQGIADIKKLIHTTTMVVRWGDMDGFNHVNNTTYFLYAQEARFAMMRDFNLVIDPQKVAPILAQTSCKFIKPIIYPETLLIETWFVSVQGKKLTFAHLIKSAQDDTLIYAVITAVVVWFDFANKISLEVPQKVLACFQ